MWKKIKKVGNVEVSDIYIINTNGIVMNTITGHVYEHNIRKDGYHQVSLECIDGIRRSMYVHRLVYAVFNGHIDDGPVINHIDTTSKVDRQRFWKFVSRLRTLKLND